MPQRPGSFPVTSAFCATLTSAAVALWANEMVSIRSAGTSRSREARQARIATAASLPAHTSANATPIFIGEPSGSPVIAIQPEVILMDESTSALDPIATLHVEELIKELKEKYTIVIVTHNMQQAARVSDHTGLFWLGQLVEFAPTTQMFTRPKEELTEAYITGRMG